MYTFSRLATLSLLTVASLLPAFAQDQHAADTTPDGRINLPELLRVIQFYNADGLSCAPASGDTEDGYVPGFDPGAQSCDPHTTDYAPQNWRIELSEILRLIQFFNAGGYRKDCLSEDGFTPGPGDPINCATEGEGEGEGEAGAEGEGAAEGGRDGEGTSEGQPEGEGEGAPEGQPEGEGEGAAEGQPEGEGEGTTEGQAEGEGEGIAEGQPEGEGEGTAGRRR